MEAIRHVPFMPASSGPCTRLRSSGTSMATRLGEPGPGPAGGRSAGGCARALVTHRARAGRPCLLARLAAIGALRPMQDAAQALRIALFREGRRSQCARDLVATSSTPADGLPSPAGLRCTGRGSRRELLAKAAGRGTWPRTPKAGRPGAEGGSRPRWASPGRASTRHPTYACSARPRRRASRASPTPARRSGHLPIRGGPTGKPASSAAPLGHLLRLREARRLAEVPRDLAAAHSTEFNSHPRIRQAQGDGLSVLRRLVSACLPVSRASVDARPLRRRHRSRTLLDDSPSPGGSPRRSAGCASPGWVRVGLSRLPSSYRP